MKTFQPACAGSTVPVVIRRMAPSSGAGSARSLPAMSKPLPCPTLENTTPAIHRDEYIDVGIREQQVCALRSDHRDAFAAQVPRGGFGDVDVLPPEESALACMRINTHQPDRGMLDAHQLQRLHGGPRSAFDVALVEPSESRCDALVQSRMDDAQATPDQ
jgi:hypothetical protein